MTLQREGREGGFKELGKFGQGRSLNYSAEELRDAGPGIEHVEKWGRGQGAEQAAEAVKGKWLLWPEGVGEGW